MIRSLEGGTSAAGNTISDYFDRTFNLKLPNRFGLKNFYPVCCE
jgi:hypothetical protein